MLEKYYRINHATGINIFISELATTIDLCEIIIDNDLLRFEKKVTGLASFEQLKEYVKTGVIVSVNISGRKILQRTTEQLNLISDEAFAELFAKANRSDFYLQNFISGKTSFVSIIRKTDADRILIALQEIGLVPLMMSIGPFVSEQVLPQLNFYDNEIVFAGYKINRNDQKEWLSVNYQDDLSSGFPIKADSEVILEKLVIPYAAAYQLILSSQLQTIAVDALRLEEKLRDKLSDTKVKVQAFVILVITFVVLLVSSIMLTYFNSSNILLQTQTQGLMKNANDLVEVNRRLDAKEKLLDDLGWENGLNKSILLDSLFQLLPGELTLKSVQVDRPRQNPTTDNKIIQFAKREIMITGNSERILAVNEWIARLRELKFIKSVTMERYDYLPGLQTGLFIIKIKY